MRDFHFHTNFISFSSTILYIRKNNKNNIILGERVNVEFFIAECTSWKALFVKFLFWEHVFKFSHIALIFTMMQIDSWTLCVSKSLWILLSRIVKEWFKKRKKKMKKIKCYCGNVEFFIAECTSWKASRHRFFIFVIKKI